MMRSMVSYDDITAPYHSVHEATDVKPPSKKLKRDPSRSHIPHLAGASDVSGSARTNSDINHDSGVEDQEDGIELTHEEIWDDSALIDAWNAANEEYETYHGSQKSWKDPPVKKSPLWYNIPPSAKKSSHQKVTSVVSDMNVGQKDDDDSKPVDYVTFVPAHDASLQSPPPPPGFETFEYTGCDTGDVVDVDNAFNRALGAMYWAGYWTAVYHQQRKLGKAMPKGNEEGEEEDSISTQG